MSILTRGTAATAANPMPSLLFCGDKAMAASLSTVPSMQTFEPGMPQFASGERSNVRIAANAALTAQLDLCAAMHALLSSLSSAAWSGSGGRDPAPQCKTTIILCFNNYPSIEYLLYYSILYYSEYLLYYIILQ